MRILKPFDRELWGLGLTTAHIFYRMPDHRRILNEFLWQEYDVCPDFPKLEKFLRFWIENLDGPLHLVEVAHAPLERSRAYRFAAHIIRLH